MTAPALAAVTSQYHIVEQATLPKVDVALFTQEKLSREERAIARLFGGHRIARGNGTVLIIRRYFDGAGVYDADTFTKISIELPNTEPFSRHRFDLSRLPTYFSTGSSGAGNKGGIASSTLVGNVIVSNFGVFWEVEIDLSSEAENFMFSRPSFALVKFKETFKASKIEHEELTVWLGADFSAHDWRKAAKP